MKRFIKNMICIVLSVPTLLIMFVLLIWSMIVSGLSVVVGRFEPYKLIDILEDLFDSMKRRIFY